MVRTLAVLFVLVGVAFGQNTTITITDSNGNQANGMISVSGNVFFHDSKGNLEFGTIRDGNVFLNTSNGEVTFGTVKNGNLFLTDQKGNTTGTIRNGNIFLSNSDGSITTGTYNQSGVITTTTTSPSPSVSSGAVQQPRTQAGAEESTEYQSGYIIGQQLGNAIGAGIQRHRINSFCKKNGDSGYWKLPDGSIVTCASVNARRPVREWPAQRSSYAPLPDPVLQDQGRRAYDLMESLRHNLTGLDPNADAGVVPEARNSWGQMRDIYCEASPGTAYIDLEGHQQTCSK